MDLSLFRPLALTISVHDLTNVRDYVLTFPSIVYMIPSMKNHPMAQAGKPKYIAGGRIPCSLRAKIMHETCPLMLNMTKAGIPNSAKLLLNCRLRIWSCWNILMTSFGLSVKSGFAPNLKSTSHKVQEINARSGPHMETNKGRKSHRICWSQNVVLLAYIHNAKRMSSHGLHATTSDIYSSAGQDQ